NSEAEDDHSSVNEPTPIIMKTAETHVAAESQAEKTPAVAAAGAGATNDKTLRIDVDVLNRMMNLVGELVLTRNQMLQSGVEST
ncbi:chemotaxis protein CheA, partial [Pseudomonas sp. FW305-127]